jgi:hypothetical protein
MPFVILPTNSISGGYDITNSLRFNAGSSDHLNRSVSTSNRRTFTFSCWVKRGKLFTTGNPDHIYGASIDGNNEFTIRFFTDNTLQVYNYASSYNFRLITTAVYRDLSAWYHIVVAVDTTQATSSNRVKLYVNGSQVTGFGTETYPSQNFDTLVNSSSTTYNQVGNMQSSNTYFDGYMADYFFIDGQQLTPSSFGETDEDTGIWKPKAYTGTYGTNGFYLQFKNSASLGTDSSGNGNTFTVNNLTSVDQSTDTPTNNFCTINPLFPQNDSLTFTNGNLQATKPSGTGGAVYYGNFGVSTGKWYWEMKCNARGGNDQWIGIGQMRTLANSNYPGDDLYCVAAGHGGEVRYNSVTVSTYTMASWTAGDIISIALDMDNSRVYWGKNGTWQDSGDPVNGTNPYTNSTIFDGNFIFPVGSLYQSGGDVAYNFGSPIYIGGSYTDGAGFGNFSYAVPSGYYALNTKNLATFG